MTDFEYVRSRTDWSPAEVANWLLTFAWHIEAAGGIRPYLARWLAAGYGPIVVTA